MKLNKRLISNFYLILIEKWTNSTLQPPLLDAGHRKERQREKLEGKGYKNQSAFIESLSDRVLSVCFHINAQNEWKLIRNNARGNSELFSYPNQNQPWCITETYTNFECLSCLNFDRLLNNLLCCLECGGRNKEINKFFFLFLTCLIFPLTVTLNPQPPLLDISWKIYWEYQHLTQGSNNTEPELIKHDTDVVPDPEQAWTPAWKQNINSYF